MAVLYRDQYDLYSNRQLAPVSFNRRYLGLAKAIVESIQPFVPKSVLEAGCGNGAALRAMQLSLPDASSVGIEPVTTAVESARAAGLNVVQAMVGEHIPAEVSARKFDLIYTNHVIEHTADPSAFLAELKGMLAPEGRLVISCPDGTHPHLEFIRADHNFSMMPYHLRVFAEKAGLVPLAYETRAVSGEEFEWEYNQLLVCKLPNAVGEARSLPSAPTSRDLEDLFENRKAYLAGVDQLGHTIAARSAGASKLFCFGAGGWACVLAGLASDVWDKVEGCVVDGEGGKSFLGKPVITYADLKSAGVDGVVIGINPINQAMIANRLTQDGFNPVRWDDIIQS